jgi:hypothetical protein
MSSMWQTRKEHRTRVVETQAGADDHPHTQHTRRCWCSMTMTPLRDDFVPCTLSPSPPNPNDVTQIPGTSLWPPSVQPPVPKIQMAERWNLPGDWCATIRPQAAISSSERGRILMYTRTFSSSPAAPSTALLVPVEVAFAVAFAVLHECDQPTPQPPTPARHRCTANVE